MANLGFIFYHHIKSTPFKFDSKFCEKIYEKVSNRVSYRMKEEQIHTIIKEEINLANIEFKAKKFDKEMKDFLE